MGEMSERQRQAAHWALTQALAEVIAVRDQAAAEIARGLPRQLEHTFAVEEAADLAGAMQALGMLGNNN